MPSSQQVKEAAIRCGADLVGVAPVERFANLPAGSRPQSIQPDARSVVVLAFQIPRGALRGIEQGTAWETFSLGSLTAVLVESTYRFCLWLEDQGWEAVPLFRHSADLRDRGVPVCRDKPAPDVIVDLDYAAHAAGLGEIGRGKFLLTREFGPRQLVTAVLTDAELPGGEVSREGLCDDCGDCAKACPARALAADRLQAAPLCEATARWYALHVESCRVCKAGKTSNPYSSDLEPMRVGAACGRACVAHLEAAGRLTRTFKHPFRPVGRPEG